jgi:hypothetical protein
LTFNKIKCQFLKLQIQKKHDFTHSKAGRRGSVDLKGQVVDEAGPRRTARVVANDCASVENVRTKKKKKMEKSAEICKSDVSVVSTTACKRYPIRSAKATCKR